MAHYKGPFHPVQGYHLVEGRRGGLYWNLTLVCGHQVRRPIEENRDRLEAGEDVPPSYLRVRCRQCRREHHEQRVEALKGD